MQNEKSRDQVDKIRNALDIVDIIGKTLPLKKDSNGIYKGATSTSSQSGASLTVDQNLQIYHDFAGRAAGGDVFNWIAYDQELDIKADFPKILRIAADMAGIQLETSTPEEKERGIERQNVRNTLTQAAELYHENLTPEIREYIKTKWGITDEIIDRLKIGYAKPGNGANLYSIIPDEILVKTGLINIVAIDGQDQMVIEHFQGRVIFPYWNSGKVVNFAARGAERDKEGNVKNPEEQELLKTPENIHERAKYKKLLVHSEKRPYIHEAVNNGYIWGEDTLRGQEYCVITEGIADAIVLMQNGIPVLSPVTTRFATHDAEKLVSIAKKLKTVYICNDNEESGAGEEGAVKTGLILQNEGVDVKIILLPKENLSKMDVAEYFLRHTKAEFEEIKSESCNILVHLLKKVTPSTSTEAVKAKSENMKKAGEFVKKTLVTIKNAEDAQFFIRNDMKNYFTKFTGEEVKDLTKIYRSAVAEESEKNPDQERKSAFDLDSESGRSSMVQMLAKEIMLSKPMKFVAGSLRIYENGVYPASAEAIKKLQKELVSIAECNHKTPIMDKHANSVIKMLEIKTSISQDECNTVEDEIAVGNGILNLRTFGLSKFTPEKVFYNKMPVDYIPDAPEPKLFMDLMNKVFKGNEEQYHLMQEVFGACLLNNYKYQSIIYLLGDGGNGKGTVVKVLTYLLGKENVSSATLNQLTDHNNVEYYLASLHGKKANICGDVGSKRIENTENIKKLSSNTDPISARLPYGQPFDFINSAKLIFAMNKMPKKDAFTTGDKRRDIIISFNNQISDTEADIKGFAEIIRDSGEMPGVFNWAIEGLKRLERNQKFSDKRTVAQKGLEYDMKSNPMKYFVDECIETDPKGGELPTAFIYEAYINFKQKHGLPELSNDELKKDLIYYCDQIGIQTREKRGTVTELRKLELNEEESIKLGKQPRVFINIRLIKEEEESNKSTQSSLKSSSFTSYREIQPESPATLEEIFTNAFN